VLRLAWLMAAALLGGCQAPPVEAPAPAERMIQPTVPTVRASIDVHANLPAGFDRSAWRFAQIGVEKIRGDEAGLTFQEGRLSGSTGCNRLSGGYQRQDTRLTVGETAMTRRFCGDAALNRQEQQVLNVLKQTQHAVIVKANGYLLLLDNRREILAELAPVTP